MCMGVEAMICQSEKSPERLMISQTPSMGGDQIISGGRRNVEDIHNLSKLSHFGPSTFLYLSI